MNITNHNIIKIQKQLEEESEKLLRDKLNDKLLK